MVQKIVIGGLGASGIIGVLFIMGVVSKALGSPLGDLSMGAAILFAIVFAALGAIGIFRRILSR